MEEGPVEIVSNPVIVSKKGLESYRLCWDFRPVNEVLEDFLVDNVGSDTDRILNFGYDKQFICLLDCKDAHNHLVAT